MRLKPWARMHLLGAGVQVRMRRAEGARTLLGGKQLGPVRGGEGSVGSGSVGSRGH